MKYFITILFLIICQCFFLKAQDLIVTNKNDSIYCKITKTNNEYVYFVFNYEGETRTTLLPHSEIKSMHKNYYFISETFTDEKQRPSNYAKFRINIAGGFSNRTAKISSSIDPSLWEYINDLKKGFHLGFDFDYFVSENIGFGIKYTSFNSSAGPIRVSYIDTTLMQRRSGSLSNDVNIKYLGPVFYTRFYDASKKVIFLFNIAPLYTLYTDHAFVLDENITYSGNTLGLNLGLGLDFLIDEHFALGFGLDYTMALLRKLTIDYPTQKTQVIILNYDELESLSRFDLSVGLKWYF
jgi:hypothetical protein